MIVLPLQLSFKGHRNYLQGPDILNGLLTATSTVEGDRFGPIVAAFHRKISRQPDVVLADPSGASVAPLNSFGHWSLGYRSGTRRGWFAESERPVSERKPYDEDSVIADCLRSSDSLTFNGVTRLNAIELAVAMVKALHNEKFPLPPSKHWVVCQFHLDLELTDLHKSGMTVRLISALGNRLTKSQLTSAGQALGQLYFSPAEK